MKFKITMLQSLMVCMFLGIVSNGYAQKSITKVSKDLSDFEKKHEKGVTTPLIKSNDSGLTASDNIQMFNGLVVIEAVAKGDPAALLAKLETLGLQKGNYFGGMISGLLPIEKIGDLEGISALKFVRPAYKPMNRVGAVTSQGDVAQFSDVARSTFGVDGTGYRVGILSDSWNTQGGQASGIATGDLPEDIMVLEEFPFPGSDEGRAMGELIYDAAPGASLAFNTAFLGQPGFANGILALADAGSDVIVDDIIYFAEPMFQDGIIGQAADIVSDAGVPYFSSAGNNLDDSYESDFNDGGKFDLRDAFSGGLLGEYVLHDFDPGPGVDFFQEVNFPGGGRDILLSFQWDEPFASVCADCPGSTSDMDILIALVDGDFNSIFANLSGINGNIGGDAVEIINVAATGGPVTAYLVIGKWTGKVGDTQYEVGQNPNPGLIKYVNFGSVPITEYATNSGTSYGHANAKRAVSVGAVRYDRTPGFGVETPIREVFSSSGGVPTLFDINGNRYDTPDVRRKPEISAVQGTNNTFFGFDYEGDGFPNFFGTSASAPHAAAVAALMLEATDGAIRPNQITKAMQKTAIDMDDPRTPKFDKGFDFATGAGFLKADDAVARAIQIGSNNPFVIANAEPTSNLKVLPNPSDGKVTFTWDSNDNEKSKLLIYNNMGLLMKEFTNDNTKRQQNDFSKYPSGIYTVKLVTDNTSEVRRFIIK